MTIPSKGLKIKTKAPYKIHPDLDKILTDGNWYKKLIETMDDGIIATDMNRTIIYVNPATCKKLGYAKDELLGMSSLEIVVEEDRERVARESEIRFSEKVSSQYEITFKTKVGSRLPVLISGSPILGDKNQTLGTYALITDIRDRKVVEKELRDKNNELQTLYNNLLELYQQLGAIIAETTTVPSTEILLFTSKHCVYCAPAEEVLQQVLTSYAGKITYRKVDIDKEPELAAEHDILSLPTIVIGKEQLTSVPDIYKLHSALFSALVPEEKFRRTRQELDNIIDNSPVAIFTINSKGTITKSNPLVEILTGVEIQAITGHNALKPETNGEALFPKSLIKLFKKGLKGKRITEDRLRIKDYSYEKADPFSIVSFKVVPMATKEGEINEILVLCEDVTKLAMQEEALSESYTKLEDLNDKLLQLNKDRSNFVELTSTKLVEPLRNSKELIDTILRGQLGMLNEELFGTMEFLRNNLDKVTKSILGIIEFSNIEAQDFSLKLGEHNLKELISQTTSLVGSVGIQKSFFGTIDVSNKVTVWCDSEQIIRVLRNLVLNAIQFTSLNCNIHFSAKDKNGLVAVYVKDNGFGIAKKDLKRIFEQYVKTDPQGAGSGLGLSMVKSLVEAHGGTVRAESEGKNKGSTFIFTLPTNEVLYKKLISKKEKSN